MTIKRSVVIDEVVEQKIRPLALFDEYLALAREEALTEFVERGTRIDVGCPACGAEASVPEFDKHGFAYVSCARCESLYASPRPDAAVLAAFHARSRSGAFRLARFLKETDDARRESILSRRAEWLLSLLDEFLASGEAVADAAAGAGAFLDEIARRRRLRRLVAVEAREDAAAESRARGYETFVGGTERLREAAPLDAICAFELLQQAYAPRTLLEQARAALRPGGLLLLTTLTVSGFDLRVLWERARNIYPPHHINLLSIEGIEHLVTEAGFELLEVSTPGQLDVPIVEAALGDAEVDRFVSYLLRRRAPHVHRSFQEFLQEHRLSSHVRVAARVAPG